MRDNARDRLIVGLDVTGRNEAERLIECLGDTVVWYKIGYQLALSGGLPLVGELVLERRRARLRERLVPRLDGQLDGRASSAA